MRSLAAIGSIKYLEEENMLESIRHFVGTSAGSIMCLFIVLGYTAQEAFEFIVHNFKRDDVSSISIDDLFEIMDSFGLNLGTNLKNFVETMLYNKLKVKDTTFLELAKNTGKNLVVCVTNLSKQREEYWNVDTTPSMSVVKAIRTSCSLPILFTPVKHNGDLYIDGGIYNNFPINYFQDKSPNDINDIIGIDVISTTSTHHNDFWGYISMLFHAVINQLNKPYETNLEKNVVTLRFQDDTWIPVSGLQVVVSRELLDKYTSIGYVKMKELLTEYEKLYKATCDITS